MFKKRLTWILLIPIVGALVGCGTSDQKVVKPDNPAPPPGVEAVKTMG